MFLDRLESGVLLYETQQGMVGVELTLWQRVYLLWTFRNFKQLSVLLLNSRELALVSGLFRNHAGTVSHLDGLRSVVGVIENFVPPPQMDLSTSHEGEHRAIEVAQSAEILPLPSLEVVPPPHPVGESSAQFIWFRRAATIAGLLLCISALVWHRSQSLSKALAHYQTPLQINESGGVLQYSAKPAVISESAAAIDSVAILIHPPATSKAAIKAASLATVVPSHKRATRAHDSASTAKASFSDDEIQATRAPLRCVYPIYPSGRVHGKVALTARVDSDGVVRSVRIVSGNRTLAAAAVRAVRQWRYGPYLKDGQRVATESNIFISFIAEDAISMSFPLSIAVTR